jgi:hypothetical protein
MVTEKDTSVSQRARVVHWSLQLFAYTVIQKFMAPFLSITFRPATTRPAGIGIIMHMCTIAWSSGMCTKFYVASQYKISGTPSGVTQIINKQEALVQIPRIRTKIIPVGSHYNQEARRGGGGVVTYAKCLGNEGKGNSRSINGISLTCEQTNRKVQSNMTPKSWRYNDTP